MNNWWNAPTNGSRSLQSQPQSQHSFLWKAFLVFIFLTCLMLLASLYIDIITPNIYALSSTSDLTYSSSKSSAAAKSSLSSKSSFSSSSSSSSSSSIGGNHGRVSVCGTEESFEYFKHNRTCKNIALDLSTSMHRIQIEQCPWPMTFLPDARDRSLFAPIPGRDDFKNFSISEAHELLKGTTLLMTGDSTIRRLFFTLCNWLGGYDKGALTDDFYHGAYGRYLCNYSYVTRDLDILLIYAGRTKIKEAATWFDDEIKKTGELRSQKDLWGDNGIHIKSEDMPPTKVAKSIHMFLQYFDWHNEQMCMNPIRKIMNSVGPNSLKVRCGYDIFFEDDTAEIIKANGNTISDSACAISRTFCQKFLSTAESAASEINVKLNGEKNSMVRYFGYGLTTTPALPHNRFFSYNNFFFEIAKSAYSLVSKSEMCSAYSNAAFKLRGNNEPVNAKCSFIDQTSWPLDGKQWTSEEVYEPKTVNGTVTRHPCFAGGDGLHVFAEQAQMMRMQNVLNAIQFQLKRSD